jgi:hypothetical protein
VADFDGDGIADVAAVEQITLQSSFVQIFFGDGGGGFPRSLTYNSPDGEEGVALAPIDLYGDGRKSLAVSTLNDDFGGSGFMVLAVDAGTIVRLSYQPSDSSVAGYPYYLNQTWIAVGDLNADGRDDVVVLNQDGGPDIFYGQGDGSFLHGAPVPGSFCSATPGQWLAIAVGDLDGDGKADLAASCQDFTVTAWLQSVDGGLESVPTFQLQNPDPHQNYPLALSIAGGRLDVLTYANFASLTWANGAFGLLGTYTATGGAIVSADFNGDGVADVACGGGAVFLGHDGGFGAPSAPFDFGAPLAAGDLDGDGKPDLVVAATSADGTIGVFLNTCSPAAP